MLQNAESWQMLFAEVPFLLPDQVRMQLNEGKPLMIKNALRSNDISSITHLWEEPQVHSGSVPMMGFVLDGTMDWRVGITSTMARKENTLKNSNYAVFSLPESTFYLAPPGVPYGTGQIPHWQGNQKGMSFQMRFFPLGMQCHISTDESTPFIPSIFPESRCYFAIRTLIEELRMPGPNCRQSTHGLLLFIMARVAHALQRIQSTEWRPVGPQITPMGNPNSAVAAACSFIQANFSRKVTLAEIAENAFVSPTHLCHLFREEKQMTLTDYITHIRLEYATSLLQHTQMNLGEVAKAVGYSNQSYFCQLFVRYFHCSPGKFRKIAIKR